MNSADTRRPPVPPSSGPLAQALGEQAEVWSLRAGASPDDARFAAAAMRAVADALAAGHVCLPQAMLADAARGPVADALHRTGIVGTLTCDGFPLIDDGEGRLYLRRYARYERQLAVALAARRVPEPADPERDAQVRAALAAAFPAGSPTAQRLAAAHAVTARLTVISGGPGTGKTYTVAALLTVLVALEPHLRIGLAAPTGKAAARLLDSLRARLDTLPPALHARLPRTASTVHRLIGQSPDGPRHHAGHPLPVDLLIVDEASMLDLALATRLLDALPPAARLILLGDKDQLAAVEAGAVFAELSSDAGLSPACAGRLGRLAGVEARALPPPPATAQPLPNTVIWLTESRRFAADSGIGRLAAQIREGNADAALATLQDGADPALDWLPSQEMDEALDRLLSDTLAPCLATLGHGEQHTRAGFDAFTRVRVLCALRDGPRGVAAANAHLARAVRRCVGAVPTASWYPGRAVLIRRNDYALGLFNGDVGLCVPQPDGQILVAFMCPDGSLRQLAPSRLPDHDDAFALSVHQAQGSEFDHVVLLLPDHDSPVLTRELLYTGVTRAARRLSLATSAEMLRIGIRRRTTRHAGLAARLLEAQRAGLAAPPD